MQSKFDYVIVGAALAGASAIAGIREVDANGSILLIGEETHAPYHRPPLTKALWSGKKQVADVFCHEDAYYDSQGVTRLAGMQIAAVDATRRTVTDRAGTRFGFSKLLLATGGRPRRLAVPGGDLPGLCYFRTLDDYLQLHPQAGPGVCAVVIGGGFIGSEIAAALNSQGVHVTLLFPSAHLCDRVFPPGLANTIEETFRSRGVRILASDRAEAIGRDGRTFIVRTQDGALLKADLVVVGIGIEPETALARSAGLEVADGVVANELLQTSHPDIYVAGDAAMFPYAALGRSMRVEHWDNAQNQGATAGRNMAGAGQRYDHMPYFFSDLFEFGYEAVGDVNTSLEIHTDWQKKNDTGMIYYLQGGRVRGAMMCNLWNKVDAARAMIRRGDRVGTPGKELARGQEIR